MVLESLTNPLKAEMHPAIVMVHGMIYSGIGLGFSLWFMPQYASILMILFITAASIPLLYNLIKYEEQKDYSELEERTLIKEHGKACLAYFMLFVGITITLMAAFLLLPPNMLQDTFAAQIDALHIINPANIIGQAANITGEAASFGFFSRVFLNNVKVLMFCLLFSFLYGAGAIFILTWNASVIAVAMGDTIRTKLGALAELAGFAKIGVYFLVGGKIVVLRYMFHGSLEIIAYMLAGLAGGIISVAVIRHHYQSRQFQHIIMDSTDLILLSLAVLFIAGMVETWVTPFFY